MVTHGSRPSESLQTSSQFSVDTPYSTLSYIYVTLWLSSKGYYKMCVWDAIKGILWNSISY